MQCSHIDTSTLVLVVGGGLFAFRQTSANRYCARNVLGARARTRVPAKDAACAAAAAAGAHVRVDGKFMLNTIPGRRIGAPIGIVNARSPGLVARAREKHRLHTFCERTRGVNVAGRPPPRYCFEQRCVHGTASRIEMDHNNLCAYYSSLLRSRCAAKRGQNFNADICI